jgi:hypothetical protein
LLILRIDGRKTYDDTAAFLLQLLPSGTSAPQTRLRYILVSTEQKALKLTAHDERMSFLSQKLEIDMENLGSSLHGINRQQLLDGQHGHTDHQHFNCCQT